MSLRRVERPLQRSLALAFLVLGSIEAWVVLLRAATHQNVIALDLDLYLEATRRWLGGGLFYDPAQLAGPYNVLQVTGVMYPPFTLALLVPFTVLPVALWWIIPGLIIAASWIRRPPTAWGWVILAALLVYPPTWQALLYGNPALWSFAFLAAGTAWGWPGAFAALKPTLAPFSLVGIRSRSWWVATGALVLLACAFLPMWPDYLRVLLNARTGDVYYLLGQWPIALALIAAPMPRLAGVRARAAVEALSNQDATTRYVHER